MMNFILDEIFNVEIRKKRTFRNWKSLFLKKRYELTMIFIEHKITDTRIVSKKQFDEVEIGAIVELTMYTNGDDMWFYTEAEAKKG